jgi:hypothetical protein
MSIQLSKYLISALLCAGLAVGSAASADASTALEPVSAHGGDAMSASASATASTYALQDTGADSHSRSAGWWRNSVALTERAGDYLEHKWSRVGMGDQAVSDKIERLSERLDAVEPPYLLGLADGVADSRQDLGRGVKHDEHLPSKLWPASKGKA